MQGGLHHHHVRRRIYKNLETFPSESALKRTVDVLMYGVAIVMPLALVPQVLQVFMTHDVAGLSLVTWAVLGVVSFCWVLYGILHKEWPIIIANGCMCVLDFAVVAGIVLYR